MWLAKTAHSVTNTQAKAMIRIQEKMEHAVEHIMQARMCQYHKSLHSLEKKGSSAEQINSAAEVMLIRILSQKQY